MASLNGAEGIMARASLTNELIKSFGPLMAVIVASILVGSVVVGGTVIAESAMGVDVIPGK